MMEQASGCIHCRRPDQTGFLLARTPLAAAANEEYEEIYIASPTKKGDFMFVFLKQKLNCA